VVRVDKFSIDYREDGSERQFYSDLTVLDGTTGQPLSTQHISVNKPLRWGECIAHDRPCCKQMS
jgi:cytochrome c biogenesis protein ResB